MRQLFVAPPVVLGLARHPLVERFDLSSLEFVLSGAAPLGAELAEACAARIGCEMIQGYGMTEMSPVSHFTAPGRNRPGVVGAASPAPSAGWSIPRAARTARRGRRASSGCAGRR